MKVGSFVTHSLIFLTAWIGLAVWGWGFAQVLSETTLMPWVLPLVSFSPSSAAFMLAVAIAVLGALLAAVVLLVVLVALQAIWHGLTKPAQSPLPLPKTND